MSETISRDFDSISPSAKALLLLKGHTDIPYARKAAELISAPEKYVPDFESKNLMMWLRTIHFESRYKSIDELLDGLTATNILELSSGFSFRGLAAIREREVYYIDTDLPDLIKIKTGFVAALQEGEAEPKGKLEILPLNALDEAQFAALVSHFPAGEVVIVNEGLLMYLNRSEKSKLCGIIRDTLKQRGGYWITADIYIRQNQDIPGVKQEDELQKFFEQHHIRDNMFESTEDAAAFFDSEGFVLDKEAAPNYAAMGTLQYLLQSATEEFLANLGKGGKIQATWRLRLKDNE